MRAFGVHSQETDAQRRDVELSKSGGLLRWLTVTNRAGNFTTFLGHLSVCWFGGEAQAE
jgi:hypothetical protein